MTVTLRDATARDAAALADVINAVIAIGGTTAHETPFSPGVFAEHFISGDDCLTCVVAVDNAGGNALGFQAIGRHPGLPGDWGDIGTFAAPAAQGRGIGQRLFAGTLIHARRLGLTAINATIRADNRPGLRYYGGLGFTEYARQEAVPLLDGTRVDRIHTRYLLPG